MTPKEPTSNAHGPVTAEDADGDPRAPRTRYHEAFEFAAEAQVITDGHGLVLEANHAATDLLRCAKHFLLGKPLALFAVGDHRARVYESLARFGTGLISDSFETQLARRGEKPRDVSVEVRLHWLLRDITAWKHAESARAELQRRLSTAQEDERRRVARDLHDTTGQLLTALALGVRAVRDSGALPPAALERLDHVQRLTDELARQVHELAARLRPTALDDLGLEAAVRNLSTNWSAHTGVEADFQPAGLAQRRFPPEVETALFRVIQEALTNIAKHAGARHVAVVLGQSDGVAVAVIEDDGLGFELEDVCQAPTPGGHDDRPRLGLLGMRERITLVGGTLELESSPGQGTTIIARLPLPAAPTS